jgi:hypothetical protein
VFNWYGKAFLRILHKQAMISNYCTKSHRWSLGIVVAYHLDGKSKGLIHVDRIVSRWAWFVFGCATCTWAGLLHLYVYLRYKRITACRVDSLLYLKQQNANYCISDWLNSDVSLTSDYQSEISIPAFKERARRYVASVFMISLQPRYWRRFDHSEEKLVIPKVSKQGIWPYFWPRFSP